MKMKLVKGLCIVVVWMIFGVIIVCGGDDDDDVLLVVLMFIVLVQFLIFFLMQLVIGFQFGLVMLNVLFILGFMFDLQIVQGIVGGLIMVNSFDQNCNVGCILVQLQYNVILISNFNNLCVMVNLVYDIMFVICGLDGIWCCNDDGNGIGFDLFIVGQFNVGIYVVYVGIFTGNIEGYIIGFSELNSVMLSSLLEFLVQ